MLLVPLLQSMSLDGSLDSRLSRRTSFLGLKLWIVIGSCVFAFILLILSLLSIWVIARRKSRKAFAKFASSRVPLEAKEIRVDNGGSNSLSSNGAYGVALSIQNESLYKGPEKMSVDLGMKKLSNPENISHCSSAYHQDRGYSSHSGDEGSLGTGNIPRQSTSYGFAAASPLVGLPEFSHLGWGHLFTLKDLESATNHFSKDSMLGEGGYGVVYRGRLINGADVAVKKLFNNLGQAEKEFRVEVEVIGHARHKNLVRLLGFCVEGSHRILVYEYMNNGNLEQWLHGDAVHRSAISWDARMNILLGTAKALAYLHEAIEPKVIHRDIKSSNILIDTEFNAKVSDFGLAKLLGSERSHITTRVMGTFGYVAPEYANTGLLNEKSDIYSFGVLMLEVISGRDPVDYGRPESEVNLVEWLKVMVGSGRAEEVVDPCLEVKPSARTLKRTLLVTLRCVNPDSEKRPKMSQVAQMLEADDLPFYEDPRHRRSRCTGSTEVESLRRVSMDVNK